LGTRTPTILVPPGSASLRDSTQREPISRIRRERARLPERAIEKKANLFLFEALTGGA
jgi:hypothetical protein